MTTPSPCFAHSPAEFPVDFHRLRRSLHWLLFSLLLLSVSKSFARTVVEIRGDAFFVDGHPTYEGRSYQGHRVEGLLFNARLVQGVFDDLNPETRNRWAYPDTGKWDPERNTNEFVAAMPEWRRSGMLAFTLNLQGGSPLGYGNAGWINPAYFPDGRLRPEYIARLDRILRQADDLGMVVILGLFYFGQAGTLSDDNAVTHGLDEVLAWLFTRGYRNIVIEICNESSDNGYKTHPLLRPAGVAQLVKRVRDTSRDGHRYPVGVSFLGTALPPPEVIAASDVIFLHGNNVGSSTRRLRDHIAAIRAVPGYHPMPIVINEDDHYGFEQPENNLVAATEEYVSWGFFDYRRPGESAHDGFQSLPVDWSISSERKRQFFELVKKITGETPTSHTGPSRPSP